jgi:hypothetical protein
MTDVGEVCAEPVVVAKASRPTVSRVVMSFFIRFSRLTWFGFARPIGRTVFETSEVYWLGADLVKEGTNHPAID